MEERKVDLRKQPPLIMKGEVPQNEYQSDTETPRHKKPSIIQKIDYSLSSDEDASTNHLKKAVNQHLDQIYDEAAA